MSVLGACLHLLIRRRLWWFQLLHPGSSVVLAFALSVTRTMLEVTRLHKIQPPALSGYLRCSVSGCDKVPDRAMVSLVNP